MLANPIRSLASACSVPVLCCSVRLSYSSLERWDFSLQPLGISPSWSVVTFLLGSILFSFALLLLSDTKFLFMLGAQKSSVFGSKGTVTQKTNFLNSWKGRASQGIGVNMILALTFPTVSVAPTKCILIAHRWFLMTVRSPDHCVALQNHALQILLLWS